MVSLRGTYWLSSAYFILLRKCCFFLFVLFSCGVHYLLRYGGKFNNTYNKAVKLFQGSLRRVLRSGLLQPLLINITDFNQFHNILRLFDVYQIFLLPQVKRWTIITYKHGIYELPNALRLWILGNQEIAKNCLNFIELWSGAYSPCQNKSFFSTSRKLLKNRN